ncbi:DNA-binding SARP family transcriptional activator [Saccharothrix coeruleofusca]|uniref:AfsR/SARP family transcriptional regulator n=1 Tax=Saccharothrix coeruleofusca TaxID=33919 RepID=UPI001AE3E2A7|nr:BTAD domain-containing putative transcriptional regulator [Saccharothrix coeruleofusca]MBP2337553.1 DNA-binding SARP family transcriptional activator [Saccharothrix coeruleofusca]
MGVGFRVLDGVEARVGDRRLELGHARQRCVLAALLVDANRAVSADRLLERVWGERPPLRARSVLRTYVSRLRGVLAGTGATITRRDGGYVLDVPPGSVDLHRFRSLVAQARQQRDDGRALALVEDALALWGGEALGGLDTLWAQAARQALELERAAADNQRVDLALRLGRHAALLAELPARAAAHPLDEQVAGQLMLALHRAGRPADALAHYQRIRRALVEQLGAEPGPRLRELHQRILTANDPGDAPHPERDAGGGRVPRQLPAPPGSFTGREHELAALDGLLGAGGRTGIAVLTGGGGMGKTWLALRWAHRRRDRFPDGQLHVDLRGFDPVAEPLAPDAVVRGFLDALGVPAPDVPAEPSAQVGLYRGLTADRRLLVVLDNARDTAQVVPLLPGGTTSAVLVTSRRLLTALVAGHDATPVEVGLLSDEQAAEVLAGHLGAARVAAEPSAAAELLRHCAGMPLALGVLAARVRTRPDLPLAALAEELADASARLDALDTGELPTTLRAVFSASVRVLGQGAARLFGLLGLVPGPDVGTAGAAALADVPLPAARQALRELEEAHLVHQHAPGRYRMHDLVRLHAGELAGEDGPAALERLADHFCHVASLAADRFAPGEPHRRPPVPVRAGPEVVFPTYRESKEWLIAERANLLALVGRSAPRHAVHLSRALARYLDSIAHYHDALALHLAAFAATGGQDGYVLCHLGTALSRIGRFAEVLGHYERALEIAAATGDLALENMAATALGIHWHQREGADAALPHYERALAAARRGGYRHSEGIALANLGGAQAERGRHEEALALLGQAGGIAEELGDPGLGAVVLSGLGDLHRRQGRAELAMRMHHRAAEMASGGSIRTIEVQVLNGLASAVHRLDGPEAALEHYGKALDHAQRTGYRLEEVLAHEGMAAALRELGRAGEGARHAERALALRAELGLRLTSSEVDVPQ